MIIWRHCFSSQRYFRECGHSIKPWKYFLIASLWSSCGNEIGAMSDLRMCGMVTSQPTNVWPTNQVWLLQIRLLESRLLWCLSSPYPGKGGQVFNRYTWYWNLPFDSWKIYRSLGLFCNVCLHESFKHLSSSSSTLDALVQVLIIINIIANIVNLDALIPKMLIAFTGFYESHSIPHMLSFPRPFSSQSNHHHHDTYHGFS